MTAPRDGLHGTRSTARPARRSTLWLVAIVLVVGVELVGTMAIPTARTASSGSSVVPAALAHRSLAPAVGPTHGDLVVTASNSPFYLPSKAIPPGHSVWYQGGNITVAAGGTLIVQNTTVSFVQFVANGGIPAVMLAHVYHIVDNGTVILRNSTITTDAFVLNPYAKLSIFVNGNMTLYDSSIQTAGFVNVGAGGDFTLNGSVGSTWAPSGLAFLAANPYVGNLTLAQPGLVGDVSFAPTLTVAKGGQASLFSASYRGLYANDLQFNGTPNPEPLSAVGVNVTNGQNWSSFSTPTDPESVMQDYLYPSAIAGGNVTIAYLNPHLTDTTARVTVYYGGTPYILGTATFFANSSGVAIVRFTPSLTANISAAGMMAWLNRSGDFGLPSGISVAFTLLSGQSIPATVLTLNLQSPVNYGISVSGPTSNFYAVDSYIGLNFTGPLTAPWGVHQLTISGGATAYLANLTVLGQLQNLTSQYANPAVVTQNASHAYFYRWGSLELLGQNHIIDVPGATVTGQYAYGLPQSNNVTTQKVNAFKTNANLSAIWSYLEYLASRAGSHAYAMSGTSGVASVLLATNDLYAASMPDGDLLGDYHFIVTPPGGGRASGFNASLPPYPSGVAAGSYGYGMPTVLGTQYVPGYFAQVSLASVNGVVVQANNVTTSTILIGQQLKVRLNLTDNGTAPITFLSATLLYNATGDRLIAAASEPVDLTHAGQGASLNLTWKVNDSVVGLLGRAVHDNLSINVVWNNLSGRLDGGGFFASTPIIVEPSHVALRGISVPPSTLSANTVYLTSGTVLYNGSQPALVQLIATPTGGGAPIVLASSPVSAASVEGAPATFVLSWNSALLSQGTQYTFTVVASYNGVTTPPTTLGTGFEVPKSAGKNLLTQTFAGLALWLWIVIAAAVVAAIVAFLLFTRRQAAGKLVECGECGNLVPEDAKVCPKCGAEFETDVVRCSRCSSTIPAASTFCPECAAQLLGKPGEAALDPERQAYSDFTERFRAEAKKELGDNYSEGAFWDWWKRQPSYTPFSQWKLQQAQATARAGMMAPPSGGPPSGGTAAPATSSRSGSAPPPGRPPSTVAATREEPAEPAMAPAPAGGSAPALRPCPNCAKEIPPEYLVCPFCGAVTQ